MKMNKIVFFTTNTIMKPKFNLMKKNQIEQKIDSEKIAVEEEKQNKSNQSPVRKCTEEQAETQNLQMTDFKEVVSPIVEKIGQESEIKGKDNEEREEENIGEIKQGLQENYSGLKEFQKDQKEAKQLIDKENLSKQQEIVLQNDIKPPVQPSSIEQNIQTEMNASQQNRHQITQNSIKCEINGENAKGQNLLNRQQMIDKIVMIVPDYQAHVEIMDQQDVLEIYRQVIASQSKQNNLFVPENDLGKAVHTNQPCNSSQPVANNEKVQSDQVVKDDTGKDIIGENAKETVLMNQLNVLDEKQLRKKLIQMFPDLNSELERMNYKQLTQILEEVQNASKNQKKQIVPPQKIQNNENKAKIMIQPMKKLNHDNNSLPEVSRNGIPKSTEKNNIATKPSFQQPKIQINEHEPKSKNTNRKKVLDCDEIRKLLAQMFPEMRKDLEQMTEFDLKKLYASIRQDELQMLMNNSGPKKIEGDKKKIIKREHEDFKDKGNQNLTYEEIIAIILNKHPMLKDHISQLSRPQVQQIYAEVSKEVNKNDFKKEKFSESMKPKFNPSPQPVSQHYDEYHGNNEEIVTKKSAPQPNHRKSYSKLDAKALRQKLMLKLPNFRKQIQCMDEKEIEALYMQTLSETEKPRPKSNDFQGQEKIKIKKPKGRPPKNRNEQDMKSPRIIIQQKKLHSNKDQQDKMLPYQDDMEYNAISYENEENNFKRDSKGDKNYDSKFTYGDGQEPFFDESRDTSNNTTTNKKKKQTTKVIKLHNDKITDKQPNKPRSKTVMVLHTEYNGGQSVQDQDEQLDQKHKYVHKNEEKQCNCNCCKKRKSFDSNNEFAKTIKSLYRAFCHD